ncbi:HK97-gp10 family putative phage morphogenesis protein [Flavobacterium sp.]|uniref:HK97-gp10 family putative phage morphogenesis protein n=1 Tax=Flavobacterium sp. TaxID=239 RepID=UPI003267641D
MAGVPGARRRGAFLMPIQGLQSLRRKLRRLPDLARQEIAKAMEKIAAEVVALAKSLVPVDDGDLLRSIGWTWGDAPKGSVSLGEVSGGRGAGNLRITIYAGDDKAFYARWVEFGTSSHENGGRFAGSEHPGTAAQPFFYPAWRALRKRARSSITRAITKSAKMAAAGS